MNEPKTRSEIARRLELCLMVAARAAKFFTSTGRVRTVALYGSVARASADHFCRDVDLMLMVDDPQIVTKVGFSLPKGRALILLHELGLENRDDELYSLMQGFAVGSDAKQWTPEDRERHLVPISVHLLPAPLTVEAMCDFARDQKDPKFLENIGRDLKRFDADRDTFVRRGVPWDQSKLDMHRASCNARHALAEIKPTVALDASTNFEGGAPDFVTLPDFTVQGLSYGNDELCWICKKKICSCCQKCGDPTCARDCPLQCPECVCLETGCKGDCCKSCGAPARAHRNGDCPIM